MPTSHINDVLNLIASTSSIKQKESILKAHQDDLLLKRVIEMALNPFHNYWIAAVDWRNYAKDGNETISLEHALDFILQLENRTFTGNAAVLQLENYISQMTQDDVEVIHKILHHDLRAGISAKTVNKVWKGLIPSFPVMLCQKNDEKYLKRMTYPAFAQKKEDGARLITIVSAEDSNTPTTIEHFTRKGKPVSFFGAFDDAILEMTKNLTVPFNVVLDGELLLQNDNGEAANRQTGNGLMTKAVRGTLKEVDSKQLVYVLWDTIDGNDYTSGRSNVSYRNRFAALLAMTKTLDDSGVTGVEVVQSRMVNSYEDAIVAFEEMLSSGNEGIILKDPNGPFENKRVSHQIKFKAEKSMDLRIIELVRGTGKNANRLGALHLQSDDGVIDVYVGTGFSDSDRDFFWEEKEKLVDCIVEVQYNDIIEEKKRDTKSLFLPVFKTLRLDKDSTDAIS